MNRARNSFVVHTQLRHVDKPFDLWLVENLPLLGGQAPRRIEFFRCWSHRALSGLIELLARYSSMVVLVRRVGSRQSRRRRCVFLPLLLQRTDRYGGLVNDALVNIDAGLVQRLCVGLAGRQRRHRSLGASQSQRSFDTRWVERHRAFERAWKIVGAGRDSFFARAAMGSAGRVQKRVVVVALLDGSAGASRSFAGRFVLAPREEVGHEARHSCGCFG